MKAKSVTKRIFRSSGLREFILAGRFTPLAVTFADSGRSSETTNEISSVRAILRQKIRELSHFNGLKSKAEEHDCRNGNSRGVKIARLGLIQTMVVADWRQTICGFEAGK